ncbi:hypothetical protein ACFCYM_35000 [Streptomyces sp. NPDC056254]|uniref:hypothetical protein n=1 Tax=Streptomyces sp. NPDC056254 TaxID=3345763 RepID=UPI0035DB0EBB
MGSTSGRARARAAAAVLAAGCFLACTPPTASAAPSQTLLYSVDGGTTWSTNVTAAPGSQILARLWYSNDTDTAPANTSLTMSLPDGYTLVPDTTRTCLSPGSTDPTHPGTEQVCSTDPGQGGPAADSAVWSNGHLTISPTAGLFGQPTDATSGIMPTGKKRYLNLHQCTYTNTSDTLTNYLPHLPWGEAGTNTANTADTLTQCGTPQPGWTLAPSHTQALDLLGRHYLNLHQCSNWSDTTTDTHTNLPATAGTATNTSNTPDTTPTCTQPNNWQPAQSSVKALDLLHNRYLNLHQCTYTHTTGDTHTNTLPTTSWGPTTTHTSNTPTDPAPACGYTPDNWTPTTNTAEPLDTLDTTRGQGYTQFTLTTPHHTQTHTTPQHAFLNGPHTGDPSSSATITIQPALAIPLLNPYTTLLTLLTLLTTKHLHTRKTAHTTNPA